MAEENDVLLKALTPEQAVAYLRTFHADHHQQVADLRRQLAAVEEERDDWKATAETAMSEAGQAILIHQRDAALADIADLRSQLAALDLGPCSLKGCGPQRAVIASSEPYVIGMCEQHVKERLQRLAAAEAREEELRAALSRLYEQTENVPVPLANWMDAVIRDARSGEESPLLGLLRETVAHLDELREAWERGSLTERDGKGGTRSNRNVDLIARLRPYVGEAGPDGDHQGEE